MKKTVLSLLSVILIITIMISAILAIDIELNIKIRRKVNALLSPYTIIEPNNRVIYLSNYESEDDPNADEVIELYRETGHLFIRFDALNDSDTSYHFDSKNKLLSIVNANQHVCISGDGTTTLNNQPLPDKITIQQINNEWYLDLIELNQTEVGKKIGLYCLNESKISTSAIILNHYEASQNLTLTTKTWLFNSEADLESYSRNKASDTFIYKIKNVFYKTPILGELKPSTVYVGTISNQSIQVVTETGQVGYIAIKDDHSIEQIEGERSVKLSSPAEEYPDSIVMTWEAVYSTNPDTTNISNMPHLDVISPTWYELSDKDGNINSKVSENYIKWARENHYKIWALASNAFDIERTHEFLNDANARQRFIQALITEIKTYGYDGINIDFENVYLEDKDALSHFVHELSVYCHLENVIVSMDVTVMGGSDNWSKCYDHEKLGKIVDFLIVMTYDEYWASSPKSGPVASYDWVKDHMEALADIVDPQKLIMGLPMYTRVWREYPSSEKTNTYQTKSTAIGMEAQANLIEKYELTPIWDDQDKLYYATFFEEDAQVKIWIEDAQTIDAKLDIIKELDLRGAAAWRRGFETPDIWLLYNKIKQNK